LLHCSNVLRYHKDVWEPSALIDRLYRSHSHALWENFGFSMRVGVLRKAVSPEDVLQDEASGAPHVIPVRC
jgi:hypothetical protein